jgi:hypothetical protein
MVFSSADTPPEFKNKMRALVAQVRVDPESYIEELHYDKATKVIHRITYIRGNKKRVGEARLDVEHDGQTIDGRSAKVNRLACGIITQLRANSSASNRMLHSVI